MTHRPLEHAILSLESGARPKGGVSANSGEVLSIGGEHLDENGGFDLSQAKRIPRAFFDSMTSGHIQSGDILVVKDGATTGKTSLVRPGASFEEAAVNEHVFCLRIDPDVAVPLFVFHFLRSPAGQREIQRDFRGATVGGISRQFVAKVSIPLPELAEQHRIAAILDKADELRAKRRAALVALGGLAQSVFVEMFGTAESPRYQDVSLGSLLRFVTSGGRGWAKYYAVTGSRFIRSLDVQMNRVSSRDVVFVDAPDNAEARRTRVEVGDVLLTITGSRIGRVAPVSEEHAGAYVSQHVAILRPDSRQVTARFLAFFLSQHGGQRQIAKAQYGQTKPGLNFEQIRAFGCPLPPRALQAEFERRVQATGQVASAVAASETEVDALFSSLQHRAFAGEL